MRAIAKASTLALIWSALLASTAVAPAWAEASGAAPITRPLVSELSVPSTAVPGRPPRVTLRIDQSGVAKVDVWVTVSEPSIRRPVIAVSMGWVSTGRTLRVGWPRGARLKVGDYQVMVTAHDHHSGAMLHPPRTVSQASLTVAAAVSVPPPSPVAAPPVTPPAPAVAGAVPTPAQTVADGAVFPVAGPHNFGGPENLFGAPRDGYLHQGQDVLTAEGTPVVAPLAGSVLTTNYQEGGAGYYAVEQTAVGFDFMFAHCKAESLVVSTGQEVSAGQALCQAGQTGDATTPHLDFEIWVEGWRTASGYPINPLPYLEAWERPGAEG